MAQLRLGLTLSIVGPRAGLLQMDEWPMALRIVAGTDVEPDADERDAFIKQTLPWEIWPDLTNARVALAIQPAAGGAPAMSDWEVAAPLAEDASFLTGLKEAVVEGGKALLADARTPLTFVFAAGEVRDVADNDEGNDEEEDEGGDGDAGTPHAAVPWPGLVATLQALASPTPSALHCTWYFKVPRNLLVGADGAPLDVFISAAPLEIHGAAHGGVTTAPPVGKYPVHVHAYTGTAATGQCQALALRKVLEHDVDELNNYWLAIRDSGDESMLDLGARLDAACEPQAWLVALSAQELAGALVADVNPDTARQHQRAATSAEVAAVIMHWKAELGASNAAKAIRDRLLRAAAMAASDHAEKARAEFRRVVVESVARLAPVRIDGEDVRVALRADESMREALAKLAEERLFPRVARRQVAPSGAEAIDLVLGDESMRLRHFDEDKDNAIDDVAQIQLFGRRSTDLALIEREAADQGAGWHALSAARYALPDATRLSTERLLGMTATYQDDVLCRELSYVGANITCDNPLEGVHRGALDVAPPDQATFMLAALRGVACRTGALRSLPLRYGDHYEFAAAVRDRAGGMAAEVSGLHPWEADLAKIATMAPPQRNKVQFLRRTPVGDCNVCPGARTAWPQVPPDVSLRCMEGRVDQTDGPAPGVLFLVPDDGNRFKALPAGPLPARYTFRVQAPTASEHVLLRWDMPSTLLPVAEREAAVQALQASLVSIFTRRDALIAAQDKAPSAQHHIAPEVAAELLPVDPAVARVGVRWRIGAGDEKTAWFDTGFTEVTMVAGAQGTSGASADGRMFTVGEGDFVHLHFHALVADADLVRFDAATLADHLLAEPAGGVRWPGYRAFKGTEVWAETAASDLPVPEESRLALNVEPQGDVAVSYTFPVGQSDFAAVDQVVIGCERWAWRNLPIPPEPGHAAADRPRRLASGPPEDLIDPVLRDQSVALDHYDRLSAIDDGFVGRRDQVVPYPREARAPAVLTVDARDRHAHADYLRYAVAFRSRYAPVLREPVSRSSKPRRIATGFRGDASRIRPPRVLAVLPLTQDMAAPGAKPGERKSPPFLVMLDEPWFREYGIGERLAARIARVKPEIPDNPEDPPQQLRYGPLPDHRLDVPAPGTLQGKEVLEVFGPFGLSHDVGGSQALANATAFVVYPPPEAPPHFNLFVEFARVLDLPTAPVGQGQPTSDFTEAVALYTLPDMAGIALGGGALGPLRLTNAGNGFTCAGADRLRPFPEAQGEVLHQYRYVLILGHSVRDGGRAVDVFLPAEAMWLAPTGTTGTLAATWLGGATHDVRKAGFNAGVVLELLLNGRYPDRHPLGDATDLKQLFRLMLDDGTKRTVSGAGPADVEDAPGMIRRVSDWFEVRFDDT